MEDSNERENELSNKDTTDELVKKSHALKEKHKKTSEVFEKLKERTEKFLASEKERDNK